MFYVGIKSHFQPFQVDKEETSPSAYLLFYRKNSSDAYSHGTPTSGCSKSYEPCRKDVEAAREEKGEKESARTENNEGREKTHSRGELKTSMVDKRSKKTVQNKKKWGDNQLTNGKGKRVVENQPECEDLDCKQDSTGTPSEKSSTDYKLRKTERKDQREHERIEDIKPVGHYSKAGGKHQILCSANGDEHELKQDAMQEEKHPNHNHNSEGQDSAVTDDLNLNHCNYSSAGTYKGLCIESLGEEAIIKHQQIKTNDEKNSKMDNDDRSERNISTLFHEGPEGKKEKPKIDICFQTMEKSERLNRESEGNQKTVQQDKDCQNQFQGEMHQIVNPVTQKGTVMIDPDSQIDTKTNYMDTLSCCISMQNQKDLLEQQIRRDEKEPSGQSENCENVNERKKITESNTERITEMQLENGSGKTNKCTEHNKHTEINIENDLNCGNDCRLGIDGQSRVKLQDRSEKPNDFQKNCESVQNETKMGKDQVANDRRKSMENIDNQQECEDLDIKQDVSDKGTLKRTVKIDPKCQNDGETSHCIVIQNQNDLLEPQIQREEKKSTGIESKILAIAVSPDTENHQESENGSGKNKKQNKRRNKKSPSLASVGLVYLPK